MTPDYSRHYREALALLADPTVTDMYSRLVYWKCAVMCRKQMEKNR